MTFVITTLGITMKMQRLLQVTLSITTLIVMKLSIVTLGITTLIIKTLGVMTLLIMTLNITAISFTCRYAECPFLTMLSVVMLNAVGLSVPAPFLKAGPSQEI